jgi:hypothetical protein
MRSLNKYTGQSRLHSDSYDPSVRERTWTALTHPGPGSHEYMQRVVEDGYEPRVKRYGADKRYNLQYSECLCNDTATKRQPYGHSRLTVAQRNVGRWSTEPDGASSEQGKKQTTQGIQTRTSEKRTSSNCSRQTRRSRFSIHLLSCPNR